ncbi:MAG TPA: hypothetical protein DEP53_08555 [Bacteroidetes bacterium]|nr:hypothetical protein [Bacteroidota bacterium]
MTPLPAALARHTTESEVFPLIQFRIFQENQGMAARETFEWLASQFWPNPDKDAKKFIHEKREYLLNIRNENERERYVQELHVQLRELKKKKTTA